MTTKGHAPHTGQLVAVGPYKIRAGGLQYLQYEQTWPGQVIVPLTSTPLPEQAEEKTVLPLYLPDFGGVVDDWEERVRELVSLLEDGFDVMTFCMAGHGRTGTVLASLVAVLEDEEQTPDPIEAVRERHCSHAVESVAQAEAIFALRGRRVPQKYYETLFQPSEETARRK